MKNLFKLIFVLFATFSFSFTALAQDAKIDHFKVKVEFHCANGQKLLIDKLSAVPGVKSVDVNLETKVVDFTYDTNITSKDGLVKEIEKVGYYTEFSNKETEINKACSHGEGEHGEQNHE